MRKFLIAYAPPDDVERARGVGVRKVIWKPHTVAELGALVVRLLDETKATRAS
jgi:CheY-like chemotaxis protein